WQVGTQLQQGHVQIGLGAVGIEGDAFLHLLHSGSDIVLSGVVVSPSLVGEWVVGLFFSKYVKMRSGGLQTFGLAGSDQNVGNIDAGRIVVRRQFDGSRQCRVGTLPILKFQIGLPELVVSLRET